MQLLHLPLKSHVVAKREAILNPVPKQWIFRVTGANQNARNLLSTDFVSTNGACLPRIFIKCNPKLQCLIKKFRSCFSWYFRFFIYCTSLLLLLLWSSSKNLTNKRNAKNNVKAGQNAIKVFNNNNSIQIRKKTVKKRFTDGSLSRFYAIWSWCKERKRRYWKIRDINCIRKKRSVANLKINV